MRFSAFVLTLLSPLASKGLGNRALQSKKTKKTTPQESYFNRISTFPVCLAIDSMCNTDSETVAEILAVAEEGNTLVYTNTEMETLGFLDISDAMNPQSLQEVQLPVPGEPTSVAVKGNYALVCVNTSPDKTNPSGVLVVYDIQSKTEITSLDLGGQPDAISVSPDGNYAAIAIENKRDGGDLPQLPAGFLVVVDISNSNPELWSTDVVQLTGLAGVLEPTDPEPEFVAINEDNVAVLTMQENNAIVLVDIVSKTVITSFSAGTLDLFDIDTVEDGIISQTGSLSNVPREPDGVTWIGTELFATANEGDWNGGSRGFTIFNLNGEIVYESGSLIEDITIQHGHYPEERSENKGNEPENLVYGEFGSSKYLFVLSEKASVVVVFDVETPDDPKFVQVLPSGVGPEGGVVIPERNLLAVASEKDDRGDKFRSSIALYELQGTMKKYPYLTSKLRNSGKPIPFSALSGLSRCLSNPKILYTVEDSFYSKTRIMEIDITKTPNPKVMKETRITDSSMALKQYLSTMSYTMDAINEIINDDETVNIDAEGIVRVNIDDACFFIASEGKGTVGDEDRPVESPNLLLKVACDGTILEVVPLPTELNNIQSRYGFEGVTAYENCVIVAFQRPWLNELHARIGIYDIDSESWKFLLYPLDTPTSQNSGWTGLSDITAIDDKTLLVLERDNQGGPDASIKKIQKITLPMSFIDVEDNFVIGKNIITTHIDLMEFFNVTNGVSGVTGGLMFEKFEGLAVSLEGDIWVSNDNDGVDDNNGEQILLKVGSI